MYSLYILFSDRQKNGVEDLSTAVCERVSGIHIATWKTSCRAKSICISVIRVTNLGDKLSYVFLLGFIDWNRKTSLSHSFR